MTESKKEACSLNELAQDELEQVVGGDKRPFCVTSLAVELADNSSNSLPLTNVAENIM